MTYKIFLDDIRIPLDAFYYTRYEIYNKLNWSIVRSFNEFIEFIEKNIDDISLISYDHDLGFETYNKCNVVSIIDYDTLTEKTGYDCAKWLCDYCIDNNKKLPDFIVHSMNPIGKKSIETYLQNFLKHNS